MTPPSKTPKKAPAKKRSTPRKPAARKPASRKAEAKKVPAKAPPKAPAKARAKSGQAAPRGRMSPKLRLSRAMPKLDKVLGEIDPPEMESVLEKAVYLIVREGASRTAANKAMAVLREEFIDWNDVRASRPSELARLIAGSTKTAPQRRVLDRCRRLREMIDQVYNDRNEPSLEFLLEMNLRDQIEYLEDLDDLGVHNAYALVQFLSGGDKLMPVSPSFAKAAKKLGLAESAAVAKVRKDIGAFAPKESFVSLQAHLTQLGEMEEDWPAALAELAV